MSAGASHSTEQAMARAISWSKPWRKPCLETWSKSSTCAIARAIMEQADIYAYTHECHSKIYSPFIHSRFHIHVAQFIYMFIDTLSRHLLFVLYYCTSIESILAYCISSTALHPLSLQVVSGPIVVVLHRFTLLLIDIS